MKFKNKIVVGLFGLLAVSVFTSYATANLLSRLYITEEIFILDKSGTKLIKTIGGFRELRASEGKEKIDSFRYTSGNKDFNKIVLHQVWEPQKDGSLKVLIEQYDDYRWVADPRFKGKKVDIKISRGVDLIKKEERVLKNFESISFVSAKNKDKRVVIRLTPHIDDEKTPKDLSHLPISSKHITLIDNARNVLIDDFGVNGKYIGIKTHAHGALLFSFYPFKDAKEIGFAYGNKIEIKTEKNKHVTFVSQTPFLPHDVRAIIYGIYKKTSGKGGYTSPMITSNTSEKHIIWSILEDN